MILKSVIVSLLILLVLICGIRALALHEQYADADADADALAAQQPFFSPIVANATKEKGCANPDACCPILYDRKNHGCNNFYFDNESLFSSTVAIIGEHPAPELPASPTVAGLPLAQSIHGNTGNTLLFRSYGGGTGSAVSLLDACNQSIVGHNTRLNATQTQINTDATQLRQLDKDLGEMKESTRSLNTQSHAFANETQQQKHTASQIYDTHCQSNNANTVKMCSNLKAFTTP
jgi:hypothetical protein